MGDERRRDPRQSAENLKARVRFADRKQFQRCYLKDISRGGIFLRTPKPGPLEANIEVTLELPGGQQVKLNGTIVHRTTAAEATASQPPGIGVQFTDLTSRVRRTLELLLEELSGSGAGPAAAAPAPPPAAPPPGRGATPPSGVADFEDRKTDPKGERKPATMALIPEEPIIEEEFEGLVVMAPPAAAAPGAATAAARSRPAAATGVDDALPAPARPARAPTPMGVRAAAPGGPSKVTLDTLRRLLWRSADVVRLGGCDYYDLIGVAPAASAIEVRAACEALRRAFDVEHPPAGLDQDAVGRVAAVVGLIGEIEQCLCDPRRRQAYDRDSRK